MLLEEYVDKGILFKQLLRLAEQGVEFKISKGIIEVNGFTIGTKGCDYAYDTIERALSIAWSKEIK